MSQVWYFYTGRRGHLEIDNARERMPMGHQTLRSFIECTLGIDYSGKIAEDSAYVFRRGGAGENE